MHLVERHGNGVTLVVELSANETCAIADMLEDCEPENADESAAQSDLIALAAGFRQHFRNEAVVGAQLLADTMQRVGAKTFGDLIGAMQEHNVERLEDVTPEMLSDGPRGSI
jgi:hypothetical protein